MKHDCVIVGAGGHAKVVIATVEAAGGRVLGLYDDDERIWGREMLGHRIDGPAERAGERGLPTVLAIGSNRTRKKLAAGLSLEWATVLHPSAVVHETVTIGAGSVVFAGCVIQPGTVIGEHAIVNTEASIDHDCAIGDFCHIAPGCRLAGDVGLGEGVFMGIGSCAIPGTRVGAWSTVGAGGAVVRDIPGGVVAVGVPAVPREIEK